MDRKPRYDLLHFRISKSEKARLESLCKQEGQSLSEFARNALLAALDKRQATTQAIEAKS